ncbi:hypothetical protein Seregon_BL70062 [Xanthomonas phage Seregon]|nr:hypothetical protein Seregon_BL70062 [Xanthomonas phage Seregon]
MRHTRREIEEAKMLGRRLAASRNAPVPPLSRLRTATTLLLRASWTLLRMSIRSVVMKMFDRTVCPHCRGEGTGYHFCDGDAVSITEGMPCRLCNARGHIGWRERESVKWGGAAKRYRLQGGFSLAKAYYLCGMTPDEISKHECGLVPLDDWPSSLRDIADLQLDREAAGHVSTT